MASEYVDVLIVGAGLSGIGAACHLQRECPDKSIAILEARTAIGGTWDVFRYPGVRSDADMFTFGYAFRPWDGAKAIADGDSIRSYIVDTAREHGVDTKIRFQHRVVRAQWSSVTARWTVTAQRYETDETNETNETGKPVETVTLTCSFLSVCAGYFRLDEGYSPVFPGAENFSGTIVHPQIWPAELDWTDKRVVVIGSGATAMTLVPSLAKLAGHVSMLQRSPSYAVAVSSRDRLADRLRRFLPKHVANRVIRAKNVLMMMTFYRLSRRRPARMKAFLRRKAAERLPVGFDVDTHFAPTYEPWDQRPGFVPSGDLFRAVSSDKADIVTSRIERFTTTGIELSSGETLRADIIVTATGLNPLALGGLALEVDGREVDISNTLAYKGMMMSDVPNFSLTLGYTNASWTLKSDLVARYLCRLLKYMDKHGYDSITPIRPELNSPDDLSPLSDLTSGWVLRSVEALPKQGPETPWRLHQNYFRDLRLMRRGPITDEVRFGYALGTKERAEVG